MWISEYIRINNRKKLYSAIPACRQAGTIRIPHFNLEAQVALADVLVCEKVLERG
jgi:hypothetical protein